MERKNQITYLVVCLHMAFCSEYFFILMCINFILIVFFQLYDMLRLLEVVSHLEDSEEFEEFRLLMKKWAVLKELVRILAIPYEATVELQRRDLTLSDTYGIWIKMELHLQNRQKKSSKSGLEGKLLDGLKKHQNTVFSNSLMKAAMFLDPRFRQRITRSSEDTEEAKEVLMALSRRLTVLSEDEAADIMNHSNESGNSSDGSFDAQKAYDQYCNRTTDGCPHNESDIEASLDAFDPSPMPLKSSVLDYWHTSFDKEHSPMLFDIAMAIFAIPPTEVDIERDFSTLRFVLSELRYNLDQETLEDILTINLNRELYLEVNMNDLNDLEKSYPPIKDK